MAQPARSLGTTSKQPSNHTYDKEELQRWGEGEKNEESAHEKTIDQVRSLFTTEHTQLRRWQWNNNKFYYGDKKWKVVDKVKDYLTPTRVGTWWTLCRLLPQCRSEERCHRGCQGLLQTMAGLIARNTNHQQTELLQKSTVQEWTSERYLDQRRYELVLRGETSKVKLDSSCRTVQACIAAMGLGLGCYITTIPVLVPSYVSLKHQVSVC